MKKIIILLFVAFTLNVLAQDLPINKKLDEKFNKMVNSYNSKKNEEAIEIGEEILNNKYGELDINRTVQIYSIMPSLYLSSNKYLEAYNCALMALKFYNLNQKTIIENPDVNVDKYNAVIDQYVTFANALVKNYNSMRSYAILDGNQYKIGKVLQNNSSPNSIKTVKESNSMNEGEKTVSIIVSGNGKSNDDAKQAALRSAIEQAFGSFISSKTEILNDQIVADQMSSVSSGNIQSYEILNESQLPDGSWGVILKAIVSVSKLTSFVEAKGIVIEIKGGMFALNIKQQLLNEQGEIKAVSELIGLLHEPMQIAFDYIIKTSDPKSLDAESKNWGIPLEVIATANKNMDFCANYFIKTLEALSLSTEDVTSYKSLNKAVFPVVINYKGFEYTYYLRKQNSIDVLNTFKRNWEFYTRLYTVESGTYTKDGFGVGQIHTFSNIDISNNTNQKTIYFLTAGQKAATFSWQDKRTLEQIEQMTGYTVKPRGIVSEFKHGGFVVFEENGHGLVASLIEPERMPWYDALDFCNALVLNGYSDWHLPTKEELNVLYLNQQINKVGGFHSILYWSSTRRTETGGAWGQNFNNGDVGEYSGGCRAVRTF